MSLPRQPTADGQSPMAKPLPSVFEPGETEANGPFSPTLSSSEGERAKLRQCVLSAVFVAFATLVFESRAVDYTASVNNMNWATPASWTPNGIPRQGDTATIPNGIRV